VHSLFPEFTACLTGTSGAVLECEDPARRKSDFSLSLYKAYLLRTRADRLKKQNKTVKLGVVVASVIPALGRLKGEFKVKVNLNHIENLSLFLLQYWNLSLSLSLSLSHSTGVGTQGLHLQPRHQPFLLVFFFFFFFRDRVS
jgi:hypothetical protein